MTTLCSCVKREAHTSLKIWQYDEEALVPKNLPAGVIRDTGLILGREDPLKEGMATHSSILAWRIPGEFQIDLPGYGP